MCGFFGHHTTGLLEQSKARQILEDVKVHISQRGPDQSHDFINDKTALTAFRLRVQGDKDGDQPLVSDDKRSILVYNGEIYNFKSLIPEFNPGTSDTGHLFEFLNRQGDIRRLNGMFSFSHTKDDTTILARDRFGIKPLYYLYTDDFFSYASEAQALFDLLESRKLDNDALSKYLSFNYIPGENHLFQNIKKLPPGHKVTYTHHNHKIKVEEYSDILEATTGQESVGSLFHRAFDDQLAHGSREKGIYLSGGMDSSLLAAAANRNFPETKLFNISFEEVGYSEKNKAQSVADFLEMELEIHDFKPADFVANLPSLVSQLSSPLADPGHFPLWFLNKRIKEKSKAVVFYTGDGADELFAGYQTVAATMIHRLFSFIPGLVKEQLSHMNLPLNLMDQSKSGLNYKINKFLSGAATENPLAHFHWRTVFSPDEIARLTGNKNSIHDNMESFLKIFERSRKIFPGDLINQLLYSDFKTWLPDNNLLKVDHASSAHGHEARVPYLENHLVSGSFQIKGNEKFHYLKNKPHIRSLFQQYFPKDLLKNKSPFHPPYQIWFSDQLKKFVKDSLYQGLLIEKNILDKRELRIQVDKGLHSSFQNPFKIYNLLHLEFWLRENHQ